MCSRLLSAALVKPSNMSTSLDCTTWSAFSDGLVLAAAVRHLRVDAARMRVNMVVALLIITCTFNLQALQICVACDLCSTFDHRCCSGA